MLGIISSTITIITASRQVFDAAKDAQGLHEAFKRVSENMPLVLDTLHDAKQVQLRSITEFEGSSDGAKRDAIENSAKAIKPAMATCEENVRKLQKMFEEVVPGDESTRMQRYWKAVQTATPGKKRRVEELMKEILEKLQILHIIRFFKDSTKSQRLANALEGINQVPSSLSDEDGRYSHFGSGSLNVNTSTGVQRNYTYGGGSGKMFNAETQHFGGME